MTAKQRSAPTFAGRLRELREAAGHQTVYALAQATGLDEIHLRRLERGERQDPSFGMVLRICAAMRVSLAAFDGVAPPPKKKGRKKKGVA